MRRSSKVKENDTRLCLGHDFVLTLIDDKVNEITAVFVEISDPDLKVRRSATNDSETKLTTMSVTIRPTPPILNSLKIVVMQIPQARFVEQRYHSVISQVITVIDVRYPNRKVCRKGKTSGNSRLTRATDGSCCLI